MSLVKQVKLSGGETVLIEVADRKIDEEARRVSLGDKAKRTFDRAWQSVMPIVRTLGEGLIASGAQEAQVKFGVTVGTDLDAFVASMSAQANFEVTLKWVAGVQVPKAPPPGDSA